jgi:hypothetical protein
MEPNPPALMPAESSPEARTLMPSETSLGASAGGASGVRQGHLPRMLQVGETVFSEDEQMGLGL